MHKQERSENNEKRGVYLNGMNKWGKEEEGPLCKKKKGRGKEGAAGTKKKRKENKTGKATTRKTRV